MKNVLICLPLLLLTPSCESLKSLTTPPATTEEQAAFDEAKQIGGAIGRATGIPFAEGILAVLVGTGGLALYRRRKKTEAS